jgi:CRISPR-associated protein Csm1
MEQSRSDKEYQTVILAALLHDIGKLIQRGSFALNVEGKHPEVSARFVAAFGQLFDDVANKELLRTLVQKHHENPEFPLELRVDSIQEPRTRALAYIVSRADSLSSAERGKKKGEEFRDYKRTPLAPVLERLSLQGEEKEPRRNYHPCALASVKELKDVFSGDLSRKKACSDVFPDDFINYTEGEINPLLQAFGREFNKKLKPSLNAKDFNCLVTHLIGILQKYASYIPSNTQETIPDVSLFDHLKTTAAIAACLYQYHSATSTINAESITSMTEARFRMVVGDLSGIQNYIFDIATVGVGGVARRLRARSLFIQLITEVICQKILKEFDLTPANTIMSSGGKFYVLLPNTIPTEEKIQQIQQEVDNWLLRELNGELALNLASISFADEGFKTEKEATGFGRVLEGLHRMLAKRKQHRFNESLIATGGWQEKEFLREVHFERERVCHSCGKFPQEKEELCRHCLRDGHIGAILPNAKYILFYRDGKGEIPLFDYSVSITSKLSGLPSSPYLVFKLNSPEMEGKDYPHPVLFKYLATHIPEAKGCDECEKASVCEVKVEQENQKDLATFGCLAHQAKGRPLLGFLKADMDNLGALFRFGLKRNSPAQSWDTISRLSTVSRQLDLFFNGWIEHLSQTEFPNCYTIFSGGDDLFFVGSWDSIVSFAERVRNDFARYTQNPDITLSVGIVINRHRYPIARAAPDADDAIDTSKKGGRNSLTLLGHTVSWFDWETVKAQRELLRKHSDEIPSAFLYSLVQYAEMWRGYQKWIETQKEGDPAGLRFQPLLAYNLVRNINAQKSPEVFNWAENLARLRPGDKTQKVTLDNLGLIANLLILEKGGT